MADHKFTLTENQEAGWQLLTDKINRQQDTTFTLDDVILDQLTTTGDREFKRDKKSKKVLAQAADDDEAVAILKARGWQVQPPRG